MTSYRIKQLYKKVKDGYILVTTPSRLMLSSQVQLTGHFICYRHHGQSAIRCNLKDFIWLLTTIFKGEDLTAINVKTYVRLYDLQLASYKVKA
jgi:hypothetical protein